tara:strand:+ start:2233 stop:3216 length:984 start_codon:yes stop_codon:yes gene_type:complete
MKKLNIGIIGYGVGQHHANAYASSDKTLIKIYDKNKFKQKKIIKDRFLLINSEKEFFKNQYDIISIASHDRDHYRQIIKSTNSTKNILCEKPICNNSTQLKKIYKKIIKEKINLESNFVLRTTDLFIDIKKKIHSKYFGEVFYIEGSYLWSRIKKLSGWRLNDKEYSFIKGAAIHMIDLICWLIEKKPIYVYAIGNNLGDKNSKKKETMVSLILEFKNKLYIKVNAFGPSIYPHYHELKVFGTKASSINEFNNNYFIKKSNVQKKIKNLKAYPDHANKKNIIKDIIKNFYKNKKFSINEDVFDVMSICFAAEKSIKQKKRIKINYLK